MTNSIQAQIVKAAIIELGSNYCAKTYLPKAMQQLEKLGKLILSSPLINADILASSQPSTNTILNYTNQCVYINFTTPLDLDTLRNRLKRFERQCHRQKISYFLSAINVNYQDKATYGKAAYDKVTYYPISTKLVTMDIDLLAIQVLSEYDTDWYLMDKCLPLKEFEKKGLQELLPLVPLTDAKLQLAAAD